MSRNTWEEVDQYIGRTLFAPDPVLEEALAASAAGGLPPIQVSQAQGRFLEVLARAVGARRILEIGTLGGYSTICLGRALAADGRLVTLEVDPGYAAVARANIARARLSATIDLRIGPALETLPKLLEEDPAPHDLVFIDADKPNIPEYFRWARRMSRPGTLIVVDNVVRDGELADAASTDPRVLGARRFVESLRDEPGLTATILQTVGSKGYDGFALVRIS